MPAKRIEFNWCGPPTPTEDMTAYSQNFYTAADEFNEWSKANPNVKIIKITDKGKGRIIVYYQD